LFGLIQAGQRLLDQTLPIAQAGMRKTDAGQIGANKQMEIGAG